MLVRDVRHRLSLAFPYGTAGGKLLSCPTGNRWSRPKYPHPVRQTRRVVTEMMGATSTSKQDVRRRQALDGAERRPSGAIWVFAAAAVLLLPGCVQRRLMIRSDPPGAMVYVDDYQIGSTPIATTFTYYGTRKIRLVKDGYQTLTVYERIDPPWYQVPPLDFFSENVVASEIRDMRVLDYQLVPQVVAPPQNLLDRAEELRTRSRTPLPPNIMPVN